VSLPNLRVSNALEKHELKVIDALQTMSVGRCSRIEVKEHLKTCLHFSGCTIPTPEEFEFMVTFVIDNYKRFCLKELGCAFEMYALNKLDVDKAIKFTPKFVGEVLSAYEKIAIKVRRSVVVELPEPKPREVPEEEILALNQEFWADSKSKDFRFLNAKAFDILWKRKQINTTILTKDEANSIKSKVLAFYRTRLQNKEDEERLSSEDFVRDQCKKFTLMLFYNNQL